MQSLRILVTKDTDNMLSILFTETQNKNQLQMTVLARESKWRKSLGRTARILNFDQSFHTEY